MRGVKVTAAQEQRIADLYLSGLTALETAKASGLSGWIVKRVIKDRGISRPRGPVAGSLPRGWLERYEPEEDDALTGGHWVVVRGIQRWVPDPTPLPVARRDVSDLIACPVCKARLSEHCKTASGRHREPHATRLVSRRCPCGERLEHRRKLCEDCRQDARRVNGRRSMRNTRERRREKEAA